MKHLFKNRSIQDLIKYNRQLLLITVILACATLLAVIALVFKEESWVLIPASNPDQRISISSNIYHESYLREWAGFVMKELFSTSPLEVEAQVANLKVVSANSKQLERFFKEHLEFVINSNVSSAFFKKSIKLVENGVLVTGRRLTKISRLLKKKL